VTDRTAQTVAGLAVMSAGVGVGYAVLSNPRLRRFAWRALRLWVGASLPAYLAVQVREAWRETNRPTPVVNRPL
jgi:hypothetical protein